MWQLGALFCCVNAIYFSSNSFLPIYLKSVGRPDLISAALTGLNFGQIPASLLLLAVAGRIERRAWPYVASGIVSLVAGLSGTRDSPAAVAAGARTQPVPAGPGTA